MEQLVAVVMGVTDQHRQLADRQRLMLVAVAVEIQDRLLEQEV